MRRQLPVLEDRHLLTVCDLFIGGTPAAKVASIVNANLAREQIRAEINRQQIYALLNEARRRGFFVLRPPADTLLQQRISDVFHVNKDHIEVVAAEGSLAGDHLASAAARLVCRLIKERAGSKPKKEVHLGVGAGSTTMKIVREIAHELRSIPDLPKLVLHAMSSGFKVDQPRTAPVSFFSFFDDLDPHKISYVGLLGPPVVMSDRSGIVGIEDSINEAMLRKGEIDIVITSLAAQNDAHGDLNQFLQKHPEEIRKLRAAGWVGDVQYRPFSNTGPLTRVSRLQAVTLFDLEDLVALARTPDKRVVLVSGQCGTCHLDRANALAPLLEVPALKVWTDILMTRDTALKLLESKAGRTGAAPRRAQRDQDGPGGGGRAG
jgi:DNA-binding transcriptional regulator LsrR (DeoR family)